MKFREKVGKETAHVSKNNLPMWRDWECAYGGEKTPRAAKGELGLNSYVRVEANRQALNG